MSACPPRPGPHFLSVGDAIAERLCERLPGDVRVLTVADMTAVKTQPAPSVQVIYDGYRIDAEQGAITSIEQTWLTVIAVSNSLTAGRAREGSRADAGPLCDDVLMALLRWRPRQGVKPLRLAAAFAPLYAGGFAYFPFAWTAALSLQAEICQT